MHRLTHLHACVTVAIAMAVSCVHLQAENPTTAAVDSDDAYARVADGRAAKIVDSLDLADTDQAARVRGIVAGQYVRLHAIHETRDAQLAAIKADRGADAPAARKRVADETTARLYELHIEFLARLAVELTPAQVDQVKDGMTYGVLPNTWRSYQEMLPQMTPEQKRQVLAWLIEAREHAMHGSTSEEKHGWFGKYKGRITNYLSAAGYDLKHAEKVWLEKKKN